jgi:hypothetical protein
LTGARFQFVLGQASGYRVLPSWPDARRALSGTELPETWVAWRLLGSNHREVARSARVFVDLGECRNQIELVRQAVIDRQAQLRAHPVAGQWSWTLCVDGQPVAVSSRHYQRQRDCDYSCTVFIGLVAGAGMTASRAPSWAAPRL